MSLGLLLRYGVTKPASGDGDSGSVDFGGYDTDTGLTSLSGWSRPWNTTPTLDIVEHKDVIGGKYLRESTGGSTNKRLLAFDAIDDDNPAIEVFAHRGYTGSISNHPHLMGVALRASGAAGSENGYVLSFEFPTAVVIRIYRLNGGTYTQLVQAFPSPVSLGAGVFTRMAFRASDEGGDVRLEAWLWNSPNAEPGSPTLSFLDSSGSKITAGGKAGLFGGQNNALITDFFSFSHSGAAPRHSSS